MKLPLPRTSEGRSQPEYVLPLSNTLTTGAGNLETEFFETSSNNLIDQSTNTDSTSSTTVSTSEILPAETTQQTFVADACRDDDTVDMASNSVPTGTLSSTTESDQYSSSFFVDVVGDIFIETFIWPQGIDADLMQSLPYTWPDD